jgi:uncharacterized protein (UPF0276 family)
MKLAVNFSEALLYLLRKNPNLPVDYIKVPTYPFPESFAQFETGEKYRRLLPHPAQPGVLDLGHPLPEQRFNRDLIREVIRRTASPYLSTHLEARTEHFPEYFQYQHRNHPTVSQALKERFLTAIATVKTETGLPLILENFPYYTTLAHFRTGSEPDFISAICQEGDCGFLLDIAHARCSAWHMRREAESYIMALPLSRLREIHLAGVREESYGMRDTHTALDETDYSLLVKVLSRATPEIVTLEYGGMPERIRGIDGNFEPIYRNDPDELERMIFRIRENIDIC